MRYNFKTIILVLLMVIVSMLILYAFINTLTVVGNHTYSLWIALYVLHRLLKKELQKT